MTTRFLLGLLGWLVWAGTAAAALPEWKSDPAKAAAELEAQWTSVNNPQRSVGIRGLLRFAVEANGLGWRPDRVEAALRRARAMQDLKTGSPTFGNFQWNSGQPGVTDLNAVEFASQLLGLIGKTQAERLTPAGRETAEAMMADAIAGLLSHTVNVEYTNIFVMKAWGLIAIGETLGRADAAAEGYRRFDEWLAYTAQYGIGEYGAVVYYGIDLDSLALIARWAGRPEARAQAEKAIRYLWTDLAANWWAPGDRMGGTNARTYDYLFGTGYTEAHTWTAGWLRQAPDLEGAGWLGGVQPNHTTFRNAVLRRPDPEWTEPWRAKVPRTVVQSWGPKPEQTAVNWIGRGASIASSGASRSRDERTLVLNLGAAPAVPQLTLFMEGRGDPYGLRKRVGGKALHLTPFLATVQRGQEVLQVLSDEPVRPGSRNRPGELEYFATQFTVPAAAEVWFGDERARPGAAAQPATVPEGKAIFVRLGDAVAGLRILIATTVANGTAPVQFVADRPGDVARRITILHAAEDPRGRATAAVWLRVADGLDDAAFVAWRREFAAAKARADLVGGQVSAEVAGLAGPLRIEADVEKGERIRLEGGEPRALLSVNGRDVGREIWAGVGR